MLICQSNFGGMNGSKGKVEEQWQVAESVLEENTLPLANAIVRAAKS